MKIFVCNWNSFNHSFIQFNALVQRGALGPFASSRRASVDASYLDYLTADFDHPVLKCQCFRHHGPFCGFISLCVALRMADSLF